MTRRPRPCFDCGALFVPTSGRTKRCRSCHGDYRDPPLPLGAKAYLAAFDRYLFAQTHTDKVEARYEMREQLDVMIDHSGAEVNTDHVPGTCSGSRHYMSEGALRAAHEAGEITTVDFQRRLYHRRRDKRRRAA